MDPTPCPPPVLQACESHLYNQQQDHISNLLGFMGGNDKTEVQNSKGFRFK